MGEYAPDDSRNVTLGTPHNPIEPERTGPREGQARDMAADAQQQKKDRFAQNADLPAGALDEGFDADQPVSPVSGRPGS